MDGFTVSHRKVIALSLYCDKVTQRKGRDEKRDGAKERNKVKRRQEDKKTNSFLHGMRLTAGGWVDKKQRSAR